ncbi:hypothetical protein K6U06_20145 [Acidiferrimicrobium sp. IK]|uniref:hypothetical protein n=1 Tax=Acidiferrimicrobium sp. IK TaxID=2871700 RepID=UPI0021CB2128|nr:hypothetical protein [Acidiferrimicrobium sp. IK]MCU4186686.1 hypothetical protein [Acidiferrimicrobium sp. IK]
MTVGERVTPPGAPAPRRRWRTKTGAWVAACTVAVIGASVAFDVGHSTTPADRAGDLRRYVAALNTDIASCNSSLRDSLSAYREVVGGRHDEKGAALSIIRGDEPNCTPEANSNLYDMDTTEAPATLRAYGVQEAATDLGSWAFPAAAAAINDLAAMLAAPTTAAAGAARSDLQARAATLAELGRSAQLVVDRAAGSLGTAVARLDVGAAGDLAAGGF